MHIVYQYEYSYITVKLFSLSLSQLGNCVRGTARSNKMGFNVLYKSGMTLFFPP